jgi:PAS domain S-box-containing protein
MNTNVTQRQASLTIMSVNATVTFMMLVATFVLPGFPVKPFPLLAATLLLGGLWLIYYWYDWAAIRFVYTLLTAVALAAAVPAEAFKDYISLAIMIPAVIALVMTNPRWVFIVGGLTWALLAQLSGWEGALVKPAGLLTFLLCLFCLAVSRLTVETSQRTASASEEKAKKQARELRLSESRYRALAANLPNSAVVLFDRTLRFVLIDGPEVEKMGFFKSAMEGKPLYEALPYASAAAVEPQMRAVLAGKQISSEYPYRDQIYTYQYMPLEDEKREISYGMILAQNVTKQRQAEEARRISEERYRSISEMISDYAYAYNVDESGRIERVWTTGSFTQITGYDREELETRGTYALYPEKDWERVQADVQRVIRGEEFTAEYEILTKFGGTRWLRIHRYPIWNENKTRVIQFYGVAQDITVPKQYQEELRENEERLRVIISNLPLVFFVIDMNGIFTVSEGKGLSLIGLKPGEAVGQSVFDLYKNDPEVAESVRKALAGEITYSLNKLGNLIFEVFFNPMYDAQNQIIGVIGVGVDTTERKKAEEDLIKERKLMRALIDHLPDNIYVIDREGRFVLNNAQSLQILGAARQEDVLGKTNFDFLPRDHSEQWLAEHQEIMKSDKGVHDQELFQPWRERERRWIVESMIPLHDEAGAVIGLIGINRDISQRKLAEKALQESEERYRITSELISDYAFSYAVGPDGSIHSSWITEESYERLTGYQNPNDLPIRFQLYHPDDAERARRDVQATMQGQSTAAEYRIITKSGEERWIYLSRRPVWSEEEQRVVAIYGAAQNITGRKQVEEQLHKLNLELEQRVNQRTTQLQEANQELEAFTYSISHDLRAPLRAINGFSRTVAQHYGSQLPERAQHYLNRIEANATRMNALIDDLLALSRLGRKEIRAEAVDMNRLVQQVLRDLLASGQGGIVQFTLGKLPPTYADSSLLQQVWINIISNAIKYSSKVERPQIEIASITKDNEIVYYTKDNGAGFDSQYAEKLFKVFQRLHSEEDFEGTGIGLATVKRIISRHEGRVWAEGEPGKGATIYFALGRSPNPS